MHDDAPSAADTDWIQILDWYDALIALTDDPVHRDPVSLLGRAADAYAEAARLATDVAERDHLVPQAVHLRSASRTTRHDGRPAQ